MSPDNASALSAVPRYARFLRWRFFGTARSACCYTYELWYSESECLGVLLHEGDRASLKGPDARVIWTVEASSYAEAVQKRDEFLASTGTAFASLGDHDACQRFLASGAYTPDRTERSASREPTTRVTQGAYLDDDGNEQSFEVPGWVSILPRLAAHLAETKTGLSLLLGQVFIERPNRELTSVLDELTVVDLRSYQGDSRMFQEFSGRIEDRTRLGELVSQRLGPSATKWRIVEAAVFKKRAG
jgi:hypothetical protein